jgi:hypothetical protein
MEMKALREELAREQGSPVITIAGQRRLNMTAIRLAPDFNALNLTEEEEEEVYRAEQERYDEWAAEVSAAQPIVFPLLFSPSSSPVEDSDNQFPLPLILQRSLLPPLKPA